LLSRKGGGKRGKWNSPPKIVRSKSGRKFVPCTLGMTRGKKVRLLDLSEKKKKKKGDGFHLPWGDGGKVVSKQPFGKERKQNFFPKSM